MINKPKKLVSTARFALNLAVLAVIIANILNPGLTSAQTSIISSILGQKEAKEVTLSATPEGRMFYPNTAYVTPDKVVKAVLTAYSSTVDQCDDDPFIAASGKRVYDGMVAANWLPLGTKIKIPALYGDKIFTVDDRMNARYGYGRMDIWMDAPRWKVNEFGVKRVEIEVYYTKKQIAKK